MTKKIPVYVKMSSSENAAAAKSLRDAWLGILSATVGWPPRVEKDLLDPNTKLAEVVIDESMVVGIITIAKRKDQVTMRFMTTQPDNLSISERKFKAVVPHAMISVDDPFWRTECRAIIEQQQQANVRGIYIYQDSDR